MTITDKTRLHKVVSMVLKEQQNNDYTSPEIQRNIENYGVLVGNIMIKNRLHWVLPGQEIDLSSWPKREHGELGNIKILSEGEGYYLIFKPFGVVVQPGAGHQNDNLVSWLLENVKEQQTFDPEIYPSRGLVHRIDKNTEGLLLVAKTVEDLKFFQSQFKARTVTKKYLCVVDGIVEKRYIIKGYQAKNVKLVRRQEWFWGEKEALEYDSKARFSESYIRPLVVCTETQKSLLEVEIRTGRMHQIRLHCQELGFPLSNDHLYNRSSDGRKEKHFHGEKEFGVGWISWLSTSKPQELDKINFDEAQKTIFGEHEYCLLSNYLKLNLPNGQVLEAESVDIGKILN
jgi:23S rRNA-/tRNA-specific pseudouridylate synthase